METEDQDHDQATDMSLVNRHPLNALLSGSLDLFSILSKISQALPPLNSFDNHPESQDRFLNRIKKPEPS